MKAITSALFLFVTQFAIGNPCGGDACYEQTFICCQRTYIKQNQIEFYHNHIFVKINGDWAQVKAIYSDDYGLYFDEVREGLWLCPCCDRENKYEWDHCRWCEICR